MMKILVGYDGSEQSEDALAFARTLAQPLAAEVEAVCVYGAPLPLSLGPAGVHEDARARSEEIVARAGDGVQGRSVESGSAAVGLAEAAEDAAAQLLVVGASHRGPLGEAVLGSVGHSLLHGAPCAIAVTPRGYAAGQAPDRHAVGVAFDGSMESRVALDEGTALARALGTSLRIISIVHPGELFPDAAWLAGDKAAANVRHERRRLELEEAVALVPDDVVCSGELLVGEPDVVLRREAGQRRLAVLLVGSRGYGAVRRTALGSVAAGLVHSSPCPVIVYPRGTTAETPGDTALSAEGQTA